MKNRLTFCAKLEIDSDQYLLDIWDSRVYLTYYLSVNQVIDPAFRGSTYVLLSFMVNCDACFHLLPEVGCVLGWMIL